MTNSELQTSPEQLRKDKLKLLSSSKNLLLLAEQDRFSELQIQQIQWQTLLEEMVTKHGVALEVIRPILQKDADQLQTLLEKKQANLVQAFSKDLNANKSVRKYVNL
ncbi:hypothetical protein [Thiomicrorhabdus xiamenensis]|uniref:Uncharacterized protein n=1 Tax=Thiomicrorhabdus xiamenensis TaxID=2739063 RepID=A0A7D4P501_9GAMM|nr:hypothetical protein [Thiomicrorhabdus xiamenensis]QKI89556.1 hypothetical protein HQN79_08250 [Thiomicrorhabdus xiamenensis]